MSDDVAALPVGAVIRDGRGWVWLRRPKGWQTPGRGGYRTSAQVMADGQGRFEELTARG